MRTELMTWRVFGQWLAVMAAHHCPTPDAYARSQWPVWWRISADQARRDHAERDLYLGLEDVRRALAALPRRN